MLTPEQVDHNANCFKAQMSGLIDFSEDRALVLKNGDWLLPLNYIDFLREVGVHFSVNRMLTAECFKSRMEKGLTFLEFNYMLMQSYDFYVLYSKYGCVLEMGGDDQWSNILGRRRAHSPQAAQGGVRHHLYPADDKRGQKDGQDGKRRGLARPGENLSL